MFAIPWKVFRLIHEGKSGERIEGIYNTNVGQINFVLTYLKNSEYGLKQAFKNHASCPECTDEQREPSGADLLILWVLGG
jgi:hypothetical protein